MPAEASSAQLVPVALRSWTDQNDFYIKELLTKGSYGKVYLAQHTNTGRDLIVKVRRLADRTAYVAPSSLPRSVRANDVKRHTRAPDALCAAAAAQRRGAARS